MSIPLPHFINQQLLETALTHKSALNEQASKATESYERLEFLGDAVLELLTTKFLYFELPQEPEGMLTAYRSALVRTEMLATLAAELGLGEKLLMSKGEERGGGRENKGLLADVFEAYVGALYLDQGLERVEQFLDEVLFPRLTQIEANKAYKDAKSLLQETVQAKGYETPSYRVLKAIGPDHDKTFTVEVVVNGKAAAQGIGNSKQSAQQAAAQAALESLEL